ncbi:hypothetical protein AFE_0823 [Acidithiobacillus ferrooxidans ATCC 23270]|uniref:Uncharacterized protein n=1 Tax=Acidithiobacillus ferrooxidans (strain ATCC 23270 / DSM 14882 / CIP 104768 / NCIMB 8455) TaxID=243159 RepID=B7J6N8_ACIF2|nr:hypothetical protein AFE_0823 [Acidithiobacillus ferrooxidans ATCC 23270]
MRMGYLAYLIEPAISSSKNRTARKVWMVATNRKGLRRRFHHWSARAFSPEKSPSLLTTKAIILKRMMTAMEPGELPVSQRHILASSHFLP